MVDWPVVPLEQAAEVRGGATPRRDNPLYWDGDIPWVTPSDLPAVGAGIVEVETTAALITAAGLASCSATLLPPGTVLFSSRATIGKVGIAATHLATNQGFTNLIPRAGVDSRYLAWTMHVHAGQITALAGSTTFKEVPKSALRRYPIAVPTLSEQRRIVEILDRADRLRRLRYEADTKFERILPALFIEMFGDPAENPKRLRKKKLGDLIKVRSGSFLPAKSMNPSGRFPVYGGNGINGYHSDFMFTKPVIVLGRVGAYCGVVHYTEPHSWVTDNALYVAEHSEELNTEYLAEALRLANLNQYAGRAAQPLISGSRIYPVEILVPPRELQNCLVGHVRRIQHNSEERQRSRAMLDRLLSSLLVHAFSGSLTASWREAHMEELLQEMEHQSKALTGAAR